MKVSLQFALDGVYFELSLQEESNFAKFGFKYILLAGQVVRSFQFFLKKIETKMKAKAAPFSIIDLY
ncbi:hypothetical protein CH375_17760 [Leptospira ellisii]|nr:hypothetical protein CH375_17760 [Leptospira ellisii]